MFECFFSDPSSRGAIIGVFGTILGTIFGFLLAEGSRFLRERHRIKKLKKVIEIELKDILKQIPLKREIISITIKNLDKKQILNPSSVKFPTIGYLSSITELYSNLDNYQRISLRIIYDIIISLEELLDNFEKDLLAAIKDKVIPSPFEAYKNKLNDFNNNLTVIDKIINSYLYGPRINLYSIKKDIKTKNSL
jgi:hypothetical protein